jgi:hypothetical protein
MMSVAREKAAVPMLHVMAADRLEMLFAAVQGGRIVAAGAPRLHEAARKLLNC